MRPDEQSPLPTLDYGTTSGSHINRLYLRYALIGPVAGAMIGVVDALTALCFWVAHGQPDFYFRGWSGVKLSLLLCTVGGGMVGAPFAAAVYFAERLRRRSVPTGRFMVLMFVIAASTCATFDYFEFRQRELWAGLWPEAVVVGLSFLSALILSRASRGGRKRGTSPLIKRGCPPFPRRRSRLPSAACLAPLAMPQAASSITRLTAAMPACASFTSRRTTTHSSN